MERLRPASMSVPATLGTIVFLVLGVPAAAQSVVGIAKDAESKQPLQGVFVTLLDSAGARLVGA